MLDNFYWFRTIIRNLLRKKSGVSGKSESGIDNWFITLCTRYTIDIKYHETQVIFFYYFSKIIIRTSSIKHQ
jgi:hypothetical protein